MALVRSSTSSGTPDLWVPLWGALTAIGLCAAVGLAVLLPGRLAFRVMTRERSGTGVRFIAARDRSIHEAWTRYGTGASDSPHVFTPVHVGSNGIELWWGGTAARPVAVIPASDVASVGVGYAALATTSPVHVLEITVTGLAEPVRLAPLGRTGILTRGGTATSTLAAEISAVLSAATAAEDGRM
ncbi:hypothetical protein N1031_03315 [Herbiconiux moechotypicola]|uniref:hypothetical protein n=1 Tax=Herbiconiux moechotypicola TaxID=637393 RepID=UPI00217EFD91|nr:hypothetical protein [Herbiconiux moechotypicola]MCS5728778.1 hypothetical protein [Herbiconiux moechotypicola]